MKHLLILLVFATPATADVGRFTMMKGETIGGGNYADPSEFIWVLDTITGVVKQCYPYSYNSVLGEIFPYCGTPTVDNVASPTEGK